jgi:hypothetical protein
MNRSDFTDWKSSPITKALYNALETNIRGLEMELGYSAGDDPRLDSKKVGAIQAYRDVLGADWFEETQE